MGFYYDHIVPHLVNLAMRNRLLKAYRERIVGLAEGRVLEIGIGSGMNLPFYTERATEILGLEPHPKLLEMASQKSRRDRATLIEGSAESIPLDRAGVDTILVTWTLCSIPDLGRALSEMHRGHKPGGQLLLVEHGLAPDEKVGQGSIGSHHSGSDSRVDAISTAQLQTWSRVPGFGSSTFRPATFFGRRRTSHGSGLGVFRWVVGRTLA